VGLAKAGFVPLKVEFGTNLKLTFNLFEKVNYLLVKNDFFIYNVNLSSSKQ